MKKKHTLILQSINYLSKRDKIIFFEWLQRIDLGCSIEFAEDKTLVNFKSTYLSDEVLLELGALFYRYKIDISNLNIFLRDILKNWVFKKKGQPSHYNMWPNKNINFSTESVILQCKDIAYYSKTDEELFFQWVNKIPAITEVIGSKNILYLFTAKKEISDQDLKELIALFYRYDVDLKQLGIFSITKNHTGLSIK